MLWPQIRCICLHYLKRLDVNTCVSLHSHSLRAYWNPQNIYLLPKHHTNRCQSANHGHLSALQKWTLQPGRKNVLFNLLFDNGDDCTGISGLVLFCFFFKLNKSFWKHFKFLTLVGNSTRFKTSLRLRFDTKSISVKTFLLQWRA